MAKLDGIYIVNETDSATYSVNVTEYPVEEGMPISDAVIRVPETFSISGFIISNNAEGDLNNLKSKMGKGTICKYVGRMIASDVLITDISVSYAKEVRNGLGITVSLKKIRVPKSPWIKKVTQPSNSGNKPVISTSSKLFHLVRAGDTYWGVSQKYGKNLNTIMNYPENPWPARVIPIGVKIRYQ
ncbi:phage baseplate protein [Carnobacterium gallinarum]|uniref:LysM peptidoglycan-binding domain-containing protein n=1 Tax=Carnobacterium gallinarum TaxID=2749 RepID=UPI00054DEA92|nr:LysM domain-containing protein [Carnobacterium gallinarum]